MEETIDFWEKEEQNAQSEQDFDTDEDVEDDDEDEENDEENDDDLEEDYENLDEESLNELRIAGEVRRAKPENFDRAIRNLNTKFLKLASESDLEYAEGKIEMNMYEYMLKNYQKVMYWITSLAKTPTCRKKFEVLSSHTHMNGEDLVLETYARILKTFADNEERLKVCTSCPHQCSEFINKTKKTNTEKFAEGRKCRPYMYYDYSEKELHNYINRSLKQNIDIKLKKLANERGERLVLKLEEPMGSSEDACELGSLISDSLGADADISKELTENLLSKKIIFTNKLAPFTLDPDIFDQEDTYLEIANDRYNEREELVKANKRATYERYGLPVPESLKPTPKTIMHNMGIPVVDLLQELDKRFELIPEDANLWERLRARAEEDDLIRIGSELDENTKSWLLRKYNVPLDEILSDEHIRRVQAEAGESEEDIEAAEFQAKLDMMECLPSYKELEEYAKNGMHENRRNYIEYLKDWNYDDDIEMVYNEKTTEIKIVDADYRVVPLPLCTYAEISIRDFLELYLSIKEGKEHFNKIFSQSKQIVSLKEFWVDFENKAYNIMESFEYALSPEDRRRIYLVEKFARRMRGKNMISPVLKNAVEVLADTKSITDRFSKLFATKVFKAIKQVAVDSGYEKYVNERKIWMSVKRKVRVPKEEREKRAWSEVDRILSLREKIENNKIDSINTAVDNTLIPNLNPQELFSSILEKMPAQETKYVLEEVKVLCTNQSGSLRNIVSV